MSYEPVHGARLGLNVPYEWWPAPSLLKQIEAAGFGWVQIPSPPFDILADRSRCLEHARAAGQAIGTTGLRAVLHGPNSLLVGSPVTDAAFEGLLFYAVEAGAEIVVYHACNLEDGPASQDLLLAETRSLAHHAAQAESLGVTIVAENLAPVFARPERLSHTPMTLRNLVNRVSSDALKLCLDVGHAHVVASLRHTSLSLLCDPVLDKVALFHLHDNFGARRDGHEIAGLDPLRLDLHLAPGRGTLPWEEIAPAMTAHDAPLVVEVHPPHRPPSRALFESTLGLLWAPSEQRLRARAIPSRLPAGHRRVIA